ncbi:hypothetical protein XBKB1_1990001 [Xenorhabdus bovienii str. kraussei Becker Underwood]|uniref:Uncharacterized protein n=1 Tax=Xenorhabdus bovienii str. kraussei Becker Underwood TaxID=1398204 RepID=A0A077PSY9_XENBV|nr:hypothetical protein XBKB1_1990001 [Xenorhabdus bovienii str. kraussei Becker Underwood]
MSVSIIYFNNNLYIEYTTQALGFLKNIFFHSLMMKSLLLKTGIKKESKNIFSHSQMNH